MGTNTSQPSLVAAARAGDERALAALVAAHLPLVYTIVRRALAGHPAVCLPVGRDAEGMPFGLQIIGPRGGDAFVLGVAAALEEAFAGDAGLGRPVPDLAALEAAPPISGMEGFLASD